MSRVGNEEEMRGKVNGHRLGYKNCTDFFFLVSR